MNRGRARLAGSDEGNMGFDVEEDKGKGVQWMIHLVGEGGE